MNKEFRAYFAELGTFYDVTEESDFTLELGNKKPILHMHCSDGVFDSLEVDILQFTGLVDKHGIKAFESDIIQSERTKLYYVIQWDDESASWVALCTDKDKDYSLGAYAWHEAAIVGNKFSNPELIKEAE